MESVVLLRACQGLKHTFHCSSVSPHLWVPVMMFDDPVGPHLYQLAAHDRARPESRTAWWGRKHKDYFKVNPVAGEKADKWRRQRKVSTAWVQLTLLLLMVRAKVAIFSHLLRAKGKVGSRSIGGQEGMKSSRPEILSSIRGCPYHPVPPP